MSVNAKVTVADYATPELRGLHAALQPGRRRSLMAALGGTLRKELTDHFRARNLEPNKRGWAKQGIWGRIEAATDLTEVTADRATVTVAEPILKTKVYGGQIRPGPGKRALAIPLREMVYGKRAASNPLPGMFVLRWRGGDRAFIARRDGERLELLYVLVRGVRVPKDPRALPPQDQVRQAIERAGHRWIERERQRARQAGGGTQ